MKHDLEIYEYREGEAVELVAELEEAASVFIPLYKGDSSRDERAAVVQGQRRKIARSITAYGGRVGKKFEIRGYHQGGEGGLLVTRVPEAMLEVAVRDKLAERQEEHQEREAGIHQDVRRRHYNWGKLGRGESVDFVVADKMEVERIKQSYLAHAKKHGGKYKQETMHERDGTMVLRVSRIDVDTEPI